MKNILKQIKSFFRETLQRRLSSWKTVLLALTTTIIIGAITYISIPKILDLFSAKKTVTEYIFSKPDNRPNEIKGEIVTLKRLQPKYYNDYFRMINNPKVLQPLYFPLKLTYTWIKNYLDKDLRKEAIGKLFMYLIFDNKDNQLAGSLEIREPNSKDPGQFGCWLNPKYWGSGRLQEAVKLITNAYFKIKDVDKFNAHVEMWNLRSYYALKKCGFKLVKTLHFDNMDSRYYLEFYNPYNSKDTEKN